MKRVSYWLVILTLTIGCKKPYSPPAISNAPSLLVVEGTILSGQDSTIFKLSRTVKLSSGTTISPVAGATVSFESTAFSVPLYEYKTGYYASPGGLLDPSQQYRLKIVLADNTTYLSDFVPVKTTPAIDSIGYIEQNDGLQFYLNTHDQNNNTRYYRWAYEETWKFHAKYQSGEVTDGTKIVLRNGNQDIFDCFAGDVSSDILLGSSAKLAQDVIFQSPLGFIPSTSEKIGVRYSVLLRQYALTSDAFSFWSNLKKNTEQLGSIFDAEPSQINGNIHNIKNLLEPVLGYVSACTVQKKRIFVDQTQLPVTWRTSYPYDCSLDSIWYKNPITMRNQVGEFLIPLGSNEIPLSHWGFPTILGYISTSRVCADCTIRGVTQAPGFWR